MARGRLTGRVPGAWKGLREGGVPPGVGGSVGYVPHPHHSPDRAGVSGCGCDNSRRTGATGDWGCGRLPCLAWGCPFGNAATHSAHRHTHSTHIRAHSGQRTQDDECGQWPVADGAAASQMPKSEIQVLSIPGYPGASTGRPHTTLGEKHEGSRQRYPGPVLVPVLVSDRHGYVSVRIRTYRSPLRPFSRSTGLVLLAGLSDASGLSLPRLQRDSWPALASVRYVRSNRQERQVPETR